MLLNLEWTLGILGSIASGFIVWAFMRITKRSDDDADEMMKLIKENTIENQSLKLAMVRVEVKLELFLKLAEQIPEIKSDQVKMGAVMRDLREKLNQ